MDTPVTAFALAGGGTKGAFEVGVVRHLVTERGLLPGVITATSAGSVLAAVLAQARTVTEFRDAVDRIRLDLLAMTRTDTVFGHQPWVQELEGTPAGAIIDGFTGSKLRPPLPADAAAVAEADPGPADRQGGPGDPVAPAGSPAAPRRRRRLHELAVVLRELPSMRRSLHELAADRTGILNLDPLEAALRGRSDSGIAPIDENLVGRPGLTLRLGVTALRTGSVHYVTEGGHLVGPDAVTRLPGEPRPGVIEGVLASSSVPLLIPPRAIADEVYCDGGVLQNVPVEAAVRVGATDVVAILACPLATPPDGRDFTGVDLVSTHLRTQAIGFYDQQRTNLAYPLAADGHLTVVAPTVDLVGPFEVHQGLMLIDMDYGVLRAAESLAGLPTAALARTFDATDRVVVAREAAWYLEEAWWRMPAGTAHDDLGATLARRKTEIRDALAEREELGVPSPTGSAAWWQGWEQHDTDPPEGLTVPAPAPAA